MKTYLTTLFALLVALPQSYGLINLGEGLVTLNVGASFFHDTSIRARSTNESDNVLTITPSLVYTRPNPWFDFSISAGIRILRYGELKEYDDENFYFDVNISPNAEYEDTRFKFAAGVNYNSETRTDEEVGNIVTVQSYGANASLDYLANRWLTILSAVSFSRQDPDSDIYNQLDRYSASLKAQIPINADLYTNGGIVYSITNSQLEAGDSETISYVVGLTGRLFTKFTGNASVGIQNRSSDNQPDRSSPFVSAFLTYDISDRMSATVSASSSFGTTLDNQTTEIQSITGSLERQFWPDLTASVSASVGRSDFYGSSEAPDRKDEFFSLNGSIDYQAFQWGSIGFQASYSDRTSTDGDFQYDRTRIGITLSGSW